MTRPRSRVMLAARLRLFRVWSNKDKLLLPMIFLTLILSGWAILAWIEIGHYLIRD